MYNQKGTNALHQLGHANTLFLRSGADRDKQVSEPKVCSRYAWRHGPIGRVRTCFRNLNKRAAEY